ncbi:hypothetical protein BT63DRAFT_457432 [Microthyrium microscopicum]|uniref:Uncharacterized protein n=1 Tax=Microthyrium microscopicum TaxID=703497 RepID=A0A6A6U4H5_9PEZI|nr:hypothetical protein BT63DRAFT_457432 [Microthyrium microscopicum]
MSGKDVASTTHTAQPAMFQNGTSGDVPKWHTPIRLKFDQMSGKDVASTTQTAQPAMFQNGTPSFFGSKLIKYGSAGDVPKWHTLILRLKFDQMSGKGVASTTYHP